MLQKRSQKSFSIEKITEIRSIDWIPLAPPDYLIDKEYLINRFVEREIFYFGTINNVSNELDMSQRNEVMRLIDNGFKSHQLIAADSTNIISICAQNIKFSKRVISESLILRIPIEQIKSLAYIKDNLTNYVIFLHGSTQVLNCTVIATDSRIKAEEICSLVNQCFQIIYTEATIRNFNRQLKPVTENSIVTRNCNQINSVSNSKLINKHSKDLEESKTGYDFDSINSDLSSSKAEFLQNFMSQLTNVLQKDEMKRFADYLSAWQQGGLFETFCSQMKQLLGPNRIGILENMKSFIDPADWFTLEQFLNEFSPQSKSCSPLGNWCQLIAKNPMPQFQMQRSLSYASTSNGVLSIYDEENSIRDDFSSPIKNAYCSKRLTEFNDNTEFSKAIDNLFNKVGDLELILSSDK